MYRFLIKIGAVFLIGVAVFVTNRPFSATGAVTHEIIHAFSALGDIGNTPYSSPVYVEGSLYGVTSEGARGCGAIYEHNTSSDISALHQFPTDGSEGCNPYGGLVYIASENALYGTTRNGGTYGSGTIFKYSFVFQSLESLYNFGDVAHPTGDGVIPERSLTYVSDTNTLYGVAPSGGSQGRGVIFSYNLSSNTYSVILSFEDGDTPSGPLIHIPGTSTLVGLTEKGGVYNKGTIFSFDFGTSSYATLHSFGDEENADGAYPRGALALANGKLYGITSGNPSGQVVLFSISTNGLNYQILYTSYDLDPFPYAGLVFDGGTKLYGTTVTGGPNQMGTIFSFDINTQTYTVEDSNFDNDIAAEIYGGLTVVVDSEKDQIFFYGTTKRGGAGEVGTIFRFAVPDTYVDDFGLDSRNDVPSGWNIVSNLYTVTGVMKDIDIPISIFDCSAQCFYFINDEKYDNPDIFEVPSEVPITTIKSGDKVQVMLYSGTCGSSQSATLDIGGIRSTFIVNTEECGGGGGGGDTTAPTVSFSMPATSTSLTVPLTISGSDNVEVTGYHVSTFNSAPRPSDCEPAPPLSSYTFSSYGTYTLYVWACDGSGNISSEPATATVTITEPVTPPAPQPDPTPTPPPSNNNANPRSSSVRVDTTSGMTQPTTPTSPAMPITPSPVDSNTPLIKKIAQAPITVLDSPIKQAIKRNFTPAQVAVIEVSLKAIVAAVTTIGGAIVLASVLFLNPLARPEFILIPLRLWNMLLTLLGTRKKPVPWGIVYDSITKQPLDPVRVSLVDIDGNVVETSITDTAGRYGFAAKPGIYKVVLSKTNYLFPSHVIAQNDMRDELYDKPYFGDYLPYDPAAPITKNIPLDPLDFDTALFAQKQGDLSIHYSKREMVADRVFNTMLLTTFLIVAASVIVYPEPYNLAILGLYIASFILRRHQKRLKQMGRIYDLYGKPLAGVLIKVYSAVDQSLVKTIKTTRSGHYYLRVPKGLYYLRIERKTTDGLMVPVYQSPELLIRYGLLNKVFNIAYS